MRLIAEQILALSSELHEKFRQLKKEVITMDEYLNSDDIIWKMPRICIDSNSFCGEYIVLSFDSGKLTCGGIGDAYGEIITSHIDVLSTDDMVDLAKIFGDV